MKRKSPYLLLELLIAFTLLAYASVFLIETPMLFLNKEISRLEEIEMQRIADAAFAEEKVALCSDMKACANLTEQNKERKFSGKAVEMGLKGLSPHQFYQYAILSVLEHEVDKELHHKWKIKVVIGFTKKEKKTVKSIRKFIYTAFVEHAPPTVK